MDNKHLTRFKKKKARKSFPDTGNSMCEDHMVSKSVVHWWDYAQVGGVHRLEGGEVTRGEVRDGRSQSLPGLRVMLQDFILQEQESH